MGFLAALRFLTIIPLPRVRETTSEEIGRSLAYFPLVGLLIGLILFGIDKGLAEILPSFVGSAVLLIALLVLTGANHLDGFIDTCDGLVAGRTPQQRWEIMRDSRVGAFGVIGACSFLILKYVSLAGVPESSRMEALILMPVLGRCAAVWAIFAFPYARPQGLGRVFKDHVTWPAVALATVVALAVSIGFMEFTGLAVMFGVGLVTFGMSALLRQKFAGLTGDTYGAVIEVGEVSSLFLVIALPSWNW